MKRILRIAGSLLVVSIACILIYNKNIDTIWKLQREYVDRNTFNALYEKYDGFIGMPINTVTDILSKNNTFFIFERNSSYAEYCYEELIKMNPEITLGGEKDKLYGIYIGTNDRAEAYSYGFFVDSSGIVVETLENMPFQ